MSLVFRSGRLDSTNVITPALSVITSISLEHTHLLGSTRDAICTEKAGIIKPMVPVVVGPNVPTDITYPIAHRLRADHVAVQGRFDNYDDENAEVSGTMMT